MTHSSELSASAIVQRDHGANRFGWGPTGHYLIGSLALQLVSEPRLRQLVTNNALRVGPDEGQLQAMAQKNIEVSNLESESQPVKPGFHWLADVPDTVWKPLRGHKENPNHYADMDLPGRGRFDGQTLFQLSLDPQRWIDFYSLARVPVTGEAISAQHWGSLPFRVWQIYLAMVSYLRQGQLTEFFCAGGILSHYVGDACQPLHGSYLSQGDPGKNEGPLHAGYESNMIDRHHAELNAQLAGLLRKASVGPDLTGGQAAAESVVALMQQARSTLPPRQIIDVWNSSAHNTTQMWTTLGDPTVHCMLAGCNRLAAIWESAWREGGGPATTSPVDPIQETTLDGLYRDPTFLPSLDLQELSTVTRTTSA